MSSPEIMVARLKPYDPQRGHVRIDWKAPWGSKYEQGEWHEFDMDDPDDVQALEFLAQVKQIPTAEHDPGAFDICTVEEAEAIIVAERTGHLEQVANLVEEKPKAPAKLKGKKAAALNASPVQHELEMQQIREAAGGNKAEAAAVSKKRAAARKARAEKATPRTRAQPKRKKAANTRKTKSGRRNSME